MPDWPAPTVVTPKSAGLISSAHAFAGFLTNVGAAGQAWVANLAVFIPVRIPRQIVVTKMVAGAGATAGGNFDIGIYDDQGNRLVSSGTQAKGSSVEHIIDVTDTPIGPGLYYLAMSADGTGSYVTMIVTGTAPVPVQKARLYGCLQMASAFVLPDPVTFAAYSTNPPIVPAIGAYYYAY